MPLAGGSTLQPQRKPQTGCHRVRFSHVDAGRRGRPGRWTRLPSPSCPLVWSPLSHHGMPTFIAALEFKPLSPRVGGRGLLVGSRRRGLRRRAERVDDAHQGVRRFASARLGRSDLHTAQRLGAAPQRPCALAVSRVVEPAADPSRKNAEPQMRSPASFSRPQTFSSAGPAGLTTIDGGLRTRRHPRLNTAGSPSLLGAPR